MLESFPFCWNGYRKTIAWIDFFARDCLHISQIGDQLVEVVELNRGKLHYNFEYSSGSLRISDSINLSRFDPSTGDGTDRTLFAPDTAKRLRKRLLTLHNLLLPPPPPPPPPPPRSRRLVFSNRLIRSVISSYLTSNARASQCPSHLFPYCVLLWYLTMVKQSDSELVNRPTISRRG